MAKIKRFPLGTFMKQFSTEAQCREYLAGLRWKSGYVCPKCDCYHAYRLTNGRYQCARCRHQVSVTAGTVLHNDLMGILLPELKRIFQKAPVGIVAVLVMDIAEIVLLSLIPFAIGSCIDGLFDRNYSWFYVLILLQFLLIIFRVFNKVFDTRVYERIIESERNSYYENAIQTNPDDSQISSRLNLVDEIPNFFEAELIQIIDMFGGIAFSLMYIFITSGLPLFLVTVAISTLVYIFTMKFHKEIAANNIKLQDHDETKEKIILSRNGQRFKRFTRAILNLRIWLSL